MKHMVGWWMMTVCRNKMNDEHINKCDDWTEDYFVCKNLIVYKAEVIYTYSIFTLVSIIWIPLCVLLSIVLISKYLICILRKWRNKLICFYPVFLNVSYQHNLVLNDQFISQRLFFEYNSQSSFSIITWSNVKCQLRVDKL